MTPLIVEVEVGHQSVQELLQLIVGPRSPVNVILHLVGGEQDTLLDPGQLQLACLGRKPLELLQLVLLVHERGQGLDHFGESRESVTETENRQRALW